RLAAPRVARGEYAGDRRGVLRCSYVPALVEVHGELLQQRVPLRMQEAHSEQHQVGADLEVAALDLLEGRRAAHLVPAEVRDAAVASHELRGHHREAALAALLVSGRGAQDQ